MLLWCSGKFNNFYGFSICSFRLFRQYMSLAYSRGAHEALRLRIDSAGTHGLHADEPPDDRAISKALENGIDITSLRARKISAQDFDIYDLILGLDSSHVRKLKAQRSPEHGAKVNLFLEYARHPNERDVPDPYYGGTEHFNNAYRLIDEGVRSIIEHYGA